MWWYSASSVLVIMMNYYNVFSPNLDGEIISQIKMTNLALAEIKELLKQQVHLYLSITSTEWLMLLIYQTNCQSKK